MDRLIRFPHFFSLLVFYHNGLKLTIIVGGIDNVLETGDFKAGLYFYKAPFLSLLYQSFGENKVRFNRGYEINTIDPFEPCKGLAIPVALIKE